MSQWSAAVSSVGLYGPELSSRETAEAAERLKKIVTRVPDFGLCVYVELRLGVLG